MLATFGNLYNALVFAFPDTAWDFKRFAVRSKKTNQWWLYANLRNLYKDVKVIENFQHPDLSWDTDGNQQPNGY